MKKSIFVIVASVLCTSSVVVAQQSGPTQNRLIVLVPQDGVTKVRKNVGATTGKLIILRSPASSGENNTTAELRRRVPHSIETTVQRSSSTPHVAVDSERAGQRDNGRDVEYQLNVKSEGSEEASFGSDRVRRWRKLTNDQFPEMTGAFRSEESPFGKSSTFRAQVPTPNLPIVAPQVVDSRFEVNLPLQSQRALPFKKRELTVRRPELAIEQSELIVDEPELIVEQPEMAVQQVELPVEQPNLTVEQPTLTVGQPALPVDQSSLTVENSTMAFEQTADPIQERAPLALGLGGRSPQLVDSVDSIQLRYSTESTPVTREEPAADSMGESKPTIVSSPKVGLTPDIPATAAPIAKKTVGVFQREQISVTVTSNQDLQADLLSQNAETERSAVAPPRATDWDVAGATSGTQTSSVPVARRSTRRISAGGLRGYLPWLILPMSGFLFWGAYRSRKKKREIASREVAESPLTRQQVSGSTTTTKRPNATTTHQKPAAAERWTKVKRRETDSLARQKTLRSENSDNAPVVPVGKPSTRDTEDAVVSNQRPRKTESLTPASVKPAEGTAKEIASQPRQSVELSSRSVEKNDLRETSTQTEVAADSTERQSSADSAGIAAGAAFNGGSLSASYDETEADTNELLSSSDASRSQRRENQEVLGRDKTTSATSRDDLTCLEGVSEDDQKAFYGAGYYRYADIEKAKAEDLSKVFADRNHRFSRSDFKSWSVQAASLRSTQSDATVHSDVPEASNEGRKLNRGTRSVTQSSSTSRTEQNPSAETRDDLTQIHGIGPATAKLLQDSGITSFHQLHETRASRLQNILDAGGSKFSLIDPRTWQEQTRFAMVSDWDGLSKWQNQHDDADAQSARKDQSTESQKASPRSTERARDYSAHAEDLTKIHGLGKASQKVLNQKGIYCFTQIASMTSQQLDDLFASMPKRFQLIDTTTWPTQAQKFADAGRSVGSTKPLNIENEILDEIETIRDLTTDANASAQQAAKEQVAPRK